MASTALTLRIIRATALPGEHVLAMLADPRDGLALLAGQRDDMAQAIERWVMPDRGLWLGVLDAVPVGALRCEKSAVSYVVDPACRGRGVGAAMVSQWVNAEVRDPLSARASRDNIASRRILERTGFGETGLTASPNGRAPMVHYRRD